MRSVNRENGMIVKFHARGKGGGSGPVDYLLGRERNREGARVLRRIFCKPGLRLSGLINRRKEK